METAQNLAETFTGTVPTDQHAAEPAVTLPVEDQTTESNLFSETPVTLDPESENDSEVTVRIPLDQIFIDGSIFPRASLDLYTVQQYAAALIRGEHLPRITVEEMKEHEYRVLKGVHRFQAYCLRHDLYTGNLVDDFYDEPLPPISETELNSIPCLIDNVPPDIHAVVFCLQDNLKHGKPLTPEDYKKVARQLYEDNVGASIKELAKSIRISRKVFKNYVSDLVEAFENEKEALILELCAQGISQAEVSQMLKEKFPRAKGLSQSQISEFLLKVNTATETSNHGEDSANAERHVSEDTTTGKTKTNGGSEAEKEITPPQPKSELKAVCDDSGDTIMILGPTSLAPSLQEKIKTEVEILVKQILQENRAKQEQDEAPGPAGPQCSNENPGSTI